MTEKKGPYILRLTLTLFLITAVVAVLLGAVNELTADTIRAQQEKKTAEALSAVLASGVTLGEPLDSYADETGMVTAVYQTSDGYAALVTASGFGGDIEMAVGVSGSGAVTGVSIISHSETSGLGANATREDFRAQYTGQSGVLAVTKDGGTIDALTGATVTSRAVTNGVNAALALAGAMK